MRARLKVAVGTLASTALLLLLASCGGGAGGGGTGGATTAGATGPTPNVASQSTGAITAFGSVFVNGHEFNTDNADVVDDDTGERTRGTAGLDVGMVVSVMAAANSRESAEVAAEIHVDPLAKGFVDASSASAGTITVMGQTVQITSGTAYVDQRACVHAATSPCTAITSQSGLKATSGSTPGNYVTVHGYLFSTGTAAQIVATLISIKDYVAPTATTDGSPFKLEGQITSISGNSVVIGGETVDLTNASCRVGGAAGVCTSMAAVGKVIAAIGVTAPVNSTFKPAAARLIRLLPETAGTQVEIEGKVSSVTGTSFVIQGITIDGSGLAANQIPGVGDKVELLGTISANGQSIKATSILEDHAAQRARYVLAGPLTKVTAGSTAGTFVVTVLGQTATVSASTMIVDQTVRPRPTFNITNFQTYLQGLSALPYVIVQVQVTSSGDLQANAFRIVTAPSNNFVLLTGPADSPMTAGTPSSVMVHGIKVLFNAALVPNAASIAKGTNILAEGSLSSAGAIDTTVTGGVFNIRGSPEEDDDFGF